MTDSRAPRTIVWLTLGNVSKTHRVVEVARAATQRGHRFVIITADAIGASLARSEGAEVIELVDQGARWEATFPSPYWPRGGRILGRIPGIDQGPRRRARIVASRRRSVMLDTAEMLDAVAAVAPEVVVTETEQHRDIRALLGAGVRLVLVDDHFGTMPGSDAPHAGSPVAPGRGLTSRVQAAVGWWLLGRRIELQHRAERWWLAGFDRISVFGEVAEQSSLPDDRIVAAGYYMFRYPGVPVIRPIVQEMLLPGDDRSGVLCGPVIGSERAEDFASATDRARWRAIVEARRSRPERRLVYAGIGTVVHHRDRFVDAVIDGLGRCDHTDVVLSLGLDFARHAERSTPSNVHLFASVPQLEVLAEADCYVGHGGLGGVQEALWFATPQVVVPGGGVGQAGTATRLAAAGLGRCIDARRVSPNRIAAEVDRVIGDEVMAARVRAVSAAMRSRSGPDSVVDAVEAAIG